jgi:hypothetical protein
MKQGKIKKLLHSDAIVMRGMMQSHARTIDDDGLKREHHKVMKYNHEGCPSLHG